ncbi:MAG: pilus assembly protein PilM [Pseudomonadota bacterium]|nr:pilus assembly protein PilM [Pseudomonadota bacterium]
MGSLTGIRLSNHDVTVAAVKRGAGARPELVAFRSAEVTDGDVALALRELLKASGLERSSCSVILGSDEYQLLMVEAPEVGNNELRAAMRWRVRELIDFHIDDAVLDIFQVPRGATANPHQMLFVVACRSAVIAEYVAAAEKSGCRLKVIDVTELALRNIASLLEEDVSGVAMLHLEPDFGVITVTQQGTLYLSRQISLGYRQLVGLEGQADLEFQLDNFVLEVQRSLDYYERQFGQPPVRALYLTPLPTRVPAIDAYVDSQIGIPVKPLDLNRLLSIDEPLGADDQARALLPIGASLRLEQEEA